MDTVEYIITVLNAQCPGDTAVVSVAVQPALTFNINPDFTVCPGLPVNPDDYITSPPNATITWTNTNTNIGLGASGNGDVPTFTSGNNTSGSTISGTIEVTMQLNDCPAVTDQFVVNVVVCDQSGQRFAPHVGAGQHSFLFCRAAQSAKLTDKLAYGSPGCCLVAEIPGDQATKPFNVVPVW